MGAGWTRHRPMDRQRRAKPGVRRIDPSDLIDRRAQKLRTSAPRRSRGHAGGTDMRRRTRPAAPDCSATAIKNGRRPTGAGLTSRGRRRLAPPAGATGSAFTGRATPLVVAPEKQGVAPGKHRFGVGRVLKHGAGGEAQLNQRPATPLAEALHVPLHVEKVCWIAARAPLHEIRDARRDGQRGHPPLRCRGLPTVSSGLGWDQMLWGNESRRSDGGGPTLVRPFPGSAAMRVRHALPQPGAPLSVTRRVPRACAPPPLPGPNPASRRQPGTAAIVSLIWLTKA
jgi:hypothetical protein